MKIFAFFKETEILSSTFFPGAISILFKKDLLYWLLCKLRRSKTLGKNRTRQILVRTTKNIFFGFWQPTLKKVCVKPLWTIRIFYKKDDIFRNDSISGAKSINSNLNSFINTLRDFSNLPCRINAQRRSFSKDQVSHNFMAEREKYVLSKSKEK